MNNVKLDYERFENLYHKYKNLFFSHIYRLTNNRTLSEDLLQESFLKIYNKFHYLKDESKFRSWAISIVSNTCKDWFKKTKRENLIYTDDLMKHEKYFSENNYINIEEQTSIKQLKSIIMRILLKFDYYEREIFLLRHYENIKYIDIAKAFKISEKTVRRKMKKAVIKLAIELERLKFISSKNIVYKDTNYEM